MDTAKVADALFTHGGNAREQEGFFLMPREDDGMGRPLDIAPLACIPTTAGTGSEVSMAAVIKAPSEKVKLEIADFPLFPRLAILDPETTRTLPAADRRGHRHGRDDPRDRGLRVVRLEPAPGRPLAAGAADDPRQPRARGRSAASRTRRRAATC